MTGRRWLKWLLGLGIALALHACGGGESGAWERARMDSLAFEGAEGAEEMSEAEMEMMIAEDYLSGLAESSEKADKGRGIAGGFEEMGEAPGDYLSFQQLPEGSYCSYSNSGMPHNLEAVPISGDYQKEVQVMIDKTIPIWNHKVYVRETNTYGAFAIFKNGKRFILLNPQFMQAAHQIAGGNNYAGLSILAHELGHHVHGHLNPSSGMNIRQREKEADGFSGAALCFLLADSNEALLAMKTFTYKLPFDVRYPTLSERIDTISKGFSFARSKQERMGLEEKAEFLAQRNPSGVNHNLLRQIAKQQGALQLESLFYELSKLSK